MVVVVTPSWVFTVRLLRHFAPYVDSEKFPSRNFHRKSAGYPESYSKAGFKMGVFRKRNLITKVVQSGVNI